MAMNEVYEESDIEILLKVDAKAKPAIFVNVTLYILHKFICAM